MTIKASTSRRQFFSWRTQQPESIGRAVSSGCARLLNQDIIDLFNRAPAKRRSL